ncbi:hypothetical protein [Candidatus Vampirococcus lugosii]|uniref:Uncharacterized protein n=1 Tax=Candidatus Vampirococcus lugosii TaxID=2789015 RepID=A0ABS5QKG4_9BACT|nr:hypothetical protein [Candidatus Vampirococcus lugosii]MBS8121572.1 hypothetical protein [Candidatus Vampirococcus lugosii]
MEEIMNEDNNLKKIKYHGLIKIFSSELEDNLELKKFKCEFIKLWFYINLHNCNCIVPYIKNLLNDEGKINIEIINDLLFSIMPYIEKTNQFGINMSNLENTNQEFKIFLEYIMYEDEVFDKSFFDGVDSSIIDFMPENLKMSFCNDKEKEIFYGSLNEIINLLRKSLKDNLFKLV